jgi:hypothetical protein
MEVMAAWCEQLICGKSRSPKRRARFGTEAWSHLERLAVRVRAPPAHRERESADRLVPLEEAAPEAALQDVARQVEHEALDDVDDTFARERRGHRLDEQFLDEAEELLQQARVPRDGGADGQDCNIRE